MATLTVTQVQPCARTATANKKDCSDSGLYFCVKKSDMPHWMLRYTSRPELQQAPHKIEEAPDLDGPDYLEWLNMLISLGELSDGARPKASIRNHDNSLSSVKLPSRHNDYGIGLWEFMVTKWPMSQASKWRSPKLKPIGNNL